MENLKEFDIKNSLWRVPDRYTNLKLIGNGAFSLVCSAYDEDLKTDVVIKKIARPFSSEKAAKRVYREIKLLKHINHYNIISLYNVYGNSCSLEHLNDVYLVTNRMQGDLSNYLKTSKLEEPQVKFFAYQIFRGLKYLHSSNIIHRDLKPSNLTINEDWELRIIDFGLARSQKEHSMTEYVVSRWYRAPEIILLMTTGYSKAIDIWSAGCIIFEMYTNRPLFPGKNPHNQLELILDVVGYPKGCNNKLSDDIIEILDKKENQPSRVDFYEHFREIPDHLAIDLLDKIFQLDPDNRITSKEALEHPFFESYHDPEDEPDAEQFDDSYEEKEFAMIQWKRMILDEIKNNRPKTRNDIDKN